MKYEVVPVVRLIWKLIQQASPPSLRLLFAFSPLSSLDFLQIKCIKIAAAFLFLLKWNIFILLISLCVSAKSMQNEKMKNVNAQLFIYLCIKKTFVFIKTIFVFFKNRFFFFSYLEKFYLFLFHFFCIHKKFFFIHFKRFFEHQSNI